MTRNPANPLGPLSPWRVLLATCLLLVSSVSNAVAAPEAHILRIDPRATQENGAPVITTVIEVVQSKRINEATGHCASLSRNSRLDCVAAAMDKKNALYQPFPFPSANAIFTVAVDGTDRPAKYLSHTKWGESARQPGVGTAWLILIDADRRMGKGFGAAKTLAEQFVRSMAPNDIVNIMFFNDRQVVSDSHWLPASKKKKALSFAKSVSSVSRSSGRSRPLLNIIKNAATDGFKALGNVGGGIKVPMHQTMVVLSSGFGGTDPSTSGPGAMEVAKYMTGGRFPKDNTALPKAPVPVISVLFPHRTFEEFAQNSAAFMQNLANPEIGGFFSVMRAGQGSRAKAIVNAVRTRFSKMYLVKWRVSCIAPKVEQTFKLVFNNVNPPILGDNTFKDVPVGIDPSTWPLDVNVKYTTEMVNREGGIYPGGRLKVFGEFCWSGEKDRAEIYFLPAGQQAPPDLGGKNIDQAKRAQQQLIAMGMRGKVIEATDTFVEYEIPDNDKLIHGSGDNGVARVVIYDNRAHRTSGVTAENILQVKATTAPLPLLLILGGLLGLIVVALLVVVVFRGGKKPAAAAATPAPIHAGVPAPVAAAPANASTATLQGSTGMFTVMLGGDIRAGRDSAQCGILLNAPSVSGVHATLRIENGQLMVRDEGSNNGTFVGGARIAAGTWSLVPHGSVVKFGPVEFSVQLS
ncbi:MAG: FHA domain-containing protein [Polyangiaceae bacterium]|nr:FHA domain-containing protein [Polyangiaceae bacterium]